MKIDIPGRKTVEIQNVLLDFNGTIAIDGKLITGVSAKINSLSHLVNFHVITADTYGTVVKQLRDTNCKIINLSTNKTYTSKCAYLNEIGKTHTLCIGNGYNDRTILKECVLGISLLQSEGLSIEALMAGDIVCKSIMDALCYLDNPKRLIATLRS
ncbi:HAD family hydrolase [Pseudoalteromonas denitrificans]|uniref:Soluble P-type ATPase n=1 Tax=Pseudoalteromonas denitrificans DSM 6059 TaxID=1123010 RepID=A0A1I1UDL1_9GAMM|nr:HAD family hydrolase [Pseudoalteromonas denitrificans]SFD66863.1 Soluble P-type ATPase [Pseudoalteromonas denitrificans DSM 6059]